MTKKWSHLVKLKQEKDLTLPKEVFALSRKASKQVLHNTYLDLAREVINCHFTYVIIW